MFLESYIIVFAQGLNTVNKAERQCTENFMFAQSLNTVDKAERQCS